MATDDPAYRAPTPRFFYVHDDLTDDVRSQHGPESPAFLLALELLDLVRRSPGQVEVLTLEHQVQALLSRGRHPPFAVAAAIGAAGERVAGQLHNRTGWFPHVRRLDITRVEDGHGGYFVASTTSTPLEAQLDGLIEAPSLAVVDDTVFSGLTMRTVLGLLPQPVLERTHAFCLRCVRETLASIAEMCPISAGFMAPGHILEDVSFVNASGLVKRIAIRRAGRPTMAFFERPQWMRAWFAGNADDIIAVCRRLNELLEPGPGSTEG